MKLRHAALAFAPAALLLASCGSTAPSGSYPVTSAARDQGYFKVGKPYQVAGRWYHPREEYAYAETGMASWYGPDFHGQSTANGEVYDMYALTAAHRTLQIPSIVRVVNLENGRETVVRVNDRGPFARERIIDLSHRAAEEIGMIGRGTAQVRVEILPEESRRIAQLAREGADQRRLDQFMARRYDRSAPEISVVQAAPPPTYSPPPPYSYAPPATYTYAASKTTAPIYASAAPTESVSAGLRPASYEVPVRSGTLFVQAGAFAQRDNAERLRSELSRFGQVRLEPLEVNGRTLHRVRLGPLASVDAAHSTVSRLQENGYSLAQVVVE